MLDELLSNGIYIVNNGGKLPQFVADNPVPGEVYLNHWDVVLESAMAYTVSHIHEIFTGKTKEGESIESPLIKTREDLAEFLKSELWKNYPREPSLWPGHVSKPLSIEVDAESIEAEILACAEVKPKGSKPFEMKKFDLRFKASGKIEYVGYFNLVMDQDEYKRLSEKAWT